MKRFILLTTFLSLAIFLRATSPSDPTGPEQPPLDLAKILTGTDSIALFEGLPRSYAKGKDTEQEKRPEPTFTVDQQTFYVKPITLTDEDRATLETIFRSGTPVKAFGGVKFCGGFHADYLIEWRRKKETVLRALVCFGCHEIRFVDSTGIIETDMTESGVQRLENVLRKYRQERPARASSAPAKPAANAAQSSVPQKRE